MNGWLLAAVVVILPACATRSTDVPVERSDPMTERRTIGDGPLGLEVIDLLLADPDRTIAAPVHAMEGEQEQDRLAGSGCHVAMVGSDQLMGLLLACEPLMRRRASWHGQVTSWKPLLQRRIPVGGIVVAVDGQEVALQEGLVTLLHRAWTQPTERGSALYVELLPVHHLRDDGRLHLLGLEEAAHRQPFPQAGVELELTPRRGAVISGEAIARRGVASGLGGSVPGVVQWLLEPSGLPPRRRVLVLLADSHSPLPRGSSTEVPRAVESAIP